MPKPICVPCGRFYRCKKNDFPFVESMPVGLSRPESGKDADGWKPYKLWNGDLWECQGCGHQIIVGHAKLPESEHYMANFAERVRNRGVTLHINDC